MPQEEMSAACVCVCVCQCVSELESGGVGGREREIHKPAISTGGSCGKPFTASQANKWRSVLKEFAGHLKQTEPLRGTSL